MPTRIFVNLPVKDLHRSIAFFTALGFKFDPQFTDETATCTWSSAFAISGPRVSTPADP